MARVTIEDCVKHVPNRFLLVQTAIRRTRQIMEGAKPLTGRRNREVVLALREIAEGKVMPVLDPSKAPSTGPGLTDREGAAARGAFLEDVGMDQAGFAGAESSRVELEELEHGFHEVEAEGGERED
jgi:DNA-directed RNA polymerase subunit omega